MRNFTFRVFSAALLLGGAVMAGSAIETPTAKTRIQPATGTLYLGSDSLTKQNPQAQYEFDTHGNEVMVSKGTLTSMEIGEHEYNYDKGYAVLLNDFYYTLDKTGAHDTVFITRTTVNDDGIRTAYETESGYDIVDNFEFDDEGHITSLRLEGDTTLLTWDGDRLAAYNHYMPSKSSSSQIRYDEIEIVYQARPLNCMDYNFDELISDFSVSGAFINAKGYFVHKISWYGIDIEGELEVKSDIIGEDSICSTAIINGTDTVYAQYFKLLDDNGSYRLRKTSPLINGSADTYSEITVWYNEFGDRVKLETTEYYAGYGVVYGSVVEDPVEYDGDRPLRKLHYYYQEEAKVLGSVLEYETWHESTAISEIKTGNEDAGGALYDMNGRKIADLSRLQIETGRFNVPAAGVYIVRENTANGMMTRKIMRK